MTGGDIADKAAKYDHCDCGLPCWRLLFVQISSDRG